MAAAAAAAAARVIRLFVVAVEGVVVLDFVEGDVEEVAKDDEDRRVFLSECCCVLCWLFFSCCCRLFWVVLFLVWLLFWSLVWVWVV